MTTISEAINRYIDSVSMARSENTAHSYRFALIAFCDTLRAHLVDPEQTPIANLKEDAIAWFASTLKVFAPATESMYLTATAGFYDYLAAERLAEPNLPRIRLLIHQRSRRPGIRLPQFPQDDIQKVLEYATRLVDVPVEDNVMRLINLRDRAFLLTLADTGLRVHEACRLRRGQLDWNEARALVTGKGNKEAVVRFSSRSLAAIKDYLTERASVDGGSGKPLASLPVFARHDRAAGKAVKPISTTTGRAIVEDRVRQALGAEAESQITPHSFRHYFVTIVLKSSGGNLKLAQELARHKNITVTQRYAHLSDDELDQGYHEIFEQK